MAGIEGHQTLHFGYRFGRVLPQSDETGQFDRRRTFLVAEERAPIAGAGHRHDRLRSVRVVQAVGHPSRNGNSPIPEQFQSSSRAVSEQISICCLSEF